MKTGMKKRGNGGFTLIEVLVVSAIMIILMAMGFTEVAQNSRMLKLTELDNMAREIYMAAESRAVLLAGSGRLEGLVKGDDNAVEADKKYFVRSDAVPEDLLPAGLIEPHLRDNCFYIVYNVPAGAVTDVFYAEAATGADKFENFTYDAAMVEAARKSRAERMKAGVNIGYYGGEADAPSLPTLDPTIPYTPGAPVITIVNGEELELKVKYDKTALDKGWALKVTLLYGTVSSELVTPAGGSYSGGVVSPAESNEVRTWILDTLNPSTTDTDYKKQFKNWVNSAPGKNFTVTASLEKDGVKVEAVPESDNSLFAKASGDGEKAYIHNLRHLQNLDKDFSSVSGKTEAHQRADIEANKVKNNVAAPGNVVSDDYKFKPIQNAELTLYKSYCAESTGNDDKRYYTIRNLTVTIASGEEKEGAGLFASVSGVGNPFTFENVSIANADIDGTDANKPAGGIVGVATSVNFKNCRVETAKITASDKDAGGIAGNVTDASFDTCKAINVRAESTGGPAGGIAGFVANGSFEACRVYWTATDKLKDVNDNNRPNYVIAGSNAGGLAGSLSMGGSNKIENSFAATTIAGNMAVGGLVGDLSRVSEASSDSAIQRSYADCYLSGTGQSVQSVVGGLIGKSSGSVNLMNVYSAGFISCNGGQSVGGLCASGTVTVQYAYAAIYYETNGATVAEAYPLAKNVQPGTNYCYFLKYTNAEWKKFDNIEGTQYAQRDTMVLGSEFVPNPDTNSYGLRQDAGTGVYPFKGLNDLSHYGDWKKESNTLAPKIRILNGDELQVEVTHNSNISSSLKVELTYDGKTIEVPSTVNPSYTKVGEGAFAEHKWTYTLDSLESDGNRFSTFLASLGNKWKDATGADTTAPTEMGKDFTVRAGAGWETFISWSDSVRSNSLFAYKGEGEDFISDSATAYIRNRRHLRNLDTAWSGVKGKTAAVQIADITAGTHTPIVNAELLSYDGANHTISEMKVAAADATAKGGAGLFGTVGVPGGTFAFTNVKLTDATVTISDPKVPAGALFGNAGQDKQATVTVMLTNCTVSGNSKVTGDDSTGGMVGRVFGDVKFNNCKTATGTTVSGLSTGGLLGRAEGTATFDANCAVGSDMAKTVAGTVTGTGHVGGLAGYVGTLVGALDGYMVSATVQNIGTGETRTAGGLVGYIDRGSSTFSSCTATNITVTGTKQVGGLVGYINSGTSKFLNCQVTGAKVEGGDQVGGLVGYVNSASSTFSSCTATNITVTGTSQVGGFVGYVKSGSSTFTSCTATNITVTGGQAGGFLGSAGQTGQPAVTVTLTDCAVNSESKVTGNNSTGGMVGHVFGNVKFNNCKTVAGTEVSGVSTGGLLGRAEGTATFYANCAVGSDTAKTVAGTVTGTGHVGGLAGYVETLAGTRGALDGYTVSGIVKNTGASGTRTAGGLVGYINSGTDKFLNCQVTGATITGGSQVGGLVGYVNSASSTFSGCTATNITVTGDSQVGGLVGRSNGTSVFDANCAVSGSTVKNTGRNAAGGLIGLAQGDSTFTSCKVSSTTVTGRYAGGLVGRNDGKITIESCSFTGRDKTTVAICASDTQDDDQAVKDDLVSAAGGLVGQVTGSVASIKGSTVTNFKAYSESAVARSMAGGLVGYVTGTTANSDKGVYTSFTMSGCNVSNAEIFTDNRVADITKYAGGLVGCTSGRVGSVNITGCETKNLKVQAYGAAGGLVGYLSDQVATKDTKVSFKDCNAINIEAGALRDKSNAGGAIGVVKSVKMDNCRVYWESSPGTEEKITGFCVGGLIGRIERYAYIKNSFAATNLKGSGPMGGLIGRTLSEVEGETDQATLYIYSCYADCYLDISDSHGADGGVGGLLGRNGAYEKTYMTNVYAAGFIIGKAKEEYVKDDKGQYVKDEKGNKVPSIVHVGGLCGKAGTTENGTVFEAKNAYSVVYDASTHTNDAKKEEFYRYNHLAYDFSSSVAEITNCYYKKYGSGGGWYLYRKGANDVSKKLSEVASGLRSSTTETARPFSQAGTVSKENTHLYGVRTDAVKTTDAGYNGYPYPGLKVFVKSNDYSGGYLPHYGDWKK